MAGGSLLSPEACYGSAWGGGQAVLPRAQLWSHLPGEWQNLRWQQGRGGRGWGQGEGPGARDRAHPLSLKSRPGGTSVSLGVLLDDLSPGPEPGPWYLGKWYRSCPQIRCALGSAGMRG